MEIPEWITAILRRTGKDPVAGVDQAAPRFSMRPQVDDLPSTSDAQRTVRDICAEAVAAAKGGWQVKLADSATWLALKSEPADRQIAVMMAAIDRRPHGSAAFAGSAWQVQHLRNTIVSQVLRRNLAFPSEVLAELLEAWLQQPYSLEYGLPGRAILGAVERLAEHGALDRKLTKMLADLRATASAGNPNKFAQQIADRIDCLLDPAAAQDRGLPNGAFAHALTASLASLPTANKARWLALGAFCAEAGDKSKPSAKWLSAAAEAISGFGCDEIADRLAAWLEHTTPDPAQPDSSLDILKGLVWLTVSLDHGQFAGLLGRFAEKCFRKIPGIGARSVKLGNAALWALSAMAEEPRAAAELFRLREKVKYPSARKLIDGRLAELAAKAGKSVEALEDLSLPTFGLDEDGVARFSFGAVRAEITIGPVASQVCWFSAAGKRVKSPPADLREHHAADITAFRQAAKDIEAARAGQVLRLEQSWIEERSWLYAEWKRSFLEHPVRRPIVSALLWLVDTRIVMVRDGSFADIQGLQVDPHDDATIALWHPLHCDPTEVLAWRRRILDLGITQPIKQVYREIYVLTDAERQTGTYSNRFAAHILRQHQFRALCQARGWRYELMGGWDGWNIPAKPLPGQAMTAEYQVEVVDDGQLSDAWVSLHLASDQVRFVDRAGQALALETIAPVVFSEIMRDVDLFVAVTSVANDPGWTDGGPDGRNGGYWREWAFGELGQSASTRRDLIAWLMPRLSIAGKLEITDKFLIVEGKRQKYAIHFGSGNIQILPSNRYLCIVPDRAPAETANLRLPFTGDGLLSTILAKAFLLVDEGKISDRTILSQL
jgi:hypothetical protein